MSLMHCMYLKAVWSPKLVTTETITCILCLASSYPAWLFLFMLSERKEECSYSSCNQESERMLDWVLTSAAISYILHLVHPLIGKDNYRFGDRSCLSDRCWNKWACLARNVKMEMPKASLDQLLATIPSQTRLDQNVSDDHLADIATKLTSWRVCSYLGISEAEETEIEMNHKKENQRRYVVLFWFCWSDVSSMYLRLATFSEKRAWV